MFRELPVSDIKQFTFSHANKAKRGCINIYFSLSEKHAQLWNSSDSSEKHQPTRNKSQELAAGLTDFNALLKEALLGLPTELSTSEESCFTRRSLLTTLLSFTAAQACVCHSTPTHPRGLYVFFKKTVQVKSPNVEPDPESPSKGWWDWKRAGEYLSTGGFYLIKGSAKS